MRKLQNHSRILLYIVLTGLSSSLCAQNVSRAFRLLERLDYERATEIFQEAYASNESVSSASFGLAIIYADDQSPFYDLVQAWSYASLAESSLDDLTQDEIDVVGEYFINTEERRSNRPVKTKMEYAIAIIEAKLIKYIREENNLDLVYEVIEKFPDFRYFDNIIHIRNQLEFRKYERMHTLEGYQEFMEKFPDAAQIGKAERYISSLSFEQTLQTNTVEAYRDYIESFPVSPEYSTALRNLHSVAFSEARKANTMQAMEDFMQEYPDALEIAEARQLQKELLFDYATKIQTLEAYNEFIRKYPEGQQYIDIFNLKSLDLGMKYLSSNPVPSNNLQWARSFELEGYLPVDVTATANSVNEYIIGGSVSETETGKHDIWMIKTGEDGKMIWNRTIGELPYQELKLLMPGNHDEIIGLGSIPSGVIPGSLPSGVDPGSIPSGNDTVLYQSWVFKMSSDGQKLWSINLDDLDAERMIILSSGQIILGGSYEQDTLGNLYALAALNENGRKLWSRVYSIPGSVQGLLALSEDQFLLAGDQWSALLDARGYMIRESDIQMNDSITSVVLTEAGDILYSGVRNNRQVIIKTGQNGGRIFEKELEPAGRLLAIPALVTGKDASVVAFCRYEDHDALQWINASNGSIERTVDLQRNFRLTGIFTDARKNLLLAGIDGQILLMKNSGMAF